MQKVKEIVAVPYERLVSEDLFEVYRFKDSIILNDMVEDTFYELDLLAEVDLKTSEESSEALDREYFSADVKALSEDGETYYAFDFAEKEGEPVIVVYDGEE